jgi:hypothetical protein
MYKGCTTGEQIDHIGDCINNLNDQYFDINEDVKEIKSTIDSSNAQIAVLAKLIETRLPNSNGEQPIHQHHPNQHVPLAHSKSHQSSTGDRLMTGRLLTGILQVDKIMTKILKRIKYIY